MKIFIFLFGGLFLFSPGNLQAEVIERVIALVNNEIITLTELEEAGGRLFEQVKESTLPSEREGKLQRARQEILDQLIENKLLEQEIKKRKIEASEREVDQTIEEIRKQNRLTENELKAALAKDGISYTAYRRQIRDELGKMRLIGREIKSKLVLKEEELSELYQKNIKDYTDPVEIKVQQIFIPLPREAAADHIDKIRKEAEAILEMARRGDDFAQLARDFSRGPEAKEGGVLGFFKPKELIPELEEAAFKLPVGEISDLVQSPNGFHILRVLERKGGEPKPFAEVQGKIREAKLQEEAEKKFKEWMKGLKAKAYIEIRL